MLLNKETNIFILFVYDKNFNLKHSLIIDIKVASKYHFN